VFHRSVADSPRFDGDTGAEIFARGIAFQFVFKFDVGELADFVMGPPSGQLPHDDFTQLVRRVGLAHRRAVTVLPKLSAPQVEELLQELERRKT
jgi:hypothetical protein